MICLASETSQSPVQSIGTLCPQTSSNNVERNFVLSTKSKQIEHFNFRHCRNDDISFDIVAINGNNVEATSDFFETIVRLVAIDNVASTLLLVWTGL